MGSEADSESERDDAGAAHLGIKCLDNGQIMEVQEALQPLTLERFDSDMFRTPPTHPSVGHLNLQQTLGLGLPQHRRKPSTGEAIPDVPDLEEQGREMARRTRRRMRGRRVAKQAVSFSLQLFTALEWGQPVEPELPTPSKSLKTPSSAKKDKRSTEEKEKEKEREKERSRMAELKKARESWPLWGALLTFLSDDTTELRSSFQHRRQQDMAARKEEGKTAKRDESDVGKHPNLTRSSTAPGSLAIGDGKQEEFTIHVQKWPVYAGSPRWPVSCRPSTTLAQFCENVAAVAKLPIGQICLLKGDVKLGKDSMASALCDLGLGEGTSLVLKLGSF